MIIWLASYPKSGNTWVRALISHYLYSKDEEFDFNLLLHIPKFIQEKYISPVTNIHELKRDSLKISELWESAQARINLDNEIKFFKTHNACASYKERWFTDEKNTLAYIYIVRDPRSIVVSLASHLSISLNHATDLILNENHIGYNGPYRLAEITASWKINYLSWKKRKNFDGIIVRYEDLIDDAENEFGKILKFINKFKKIDIDEKKIKKSVFTCNFSNLSKLESSYGFEEAQKNKFFRIGKKDSWKNELSTDLKKRVESNFKNEMEELGYL